MTLGKATLLLSVIMIAAIVGATLLLNALGW